VVDDKQLLQTTQEVLRRRILTKEAPNDLRNTYADVYFLDTYGRAPTLDDLKQGNSRALAFITEDDSGRKVRTVPGNRPPYNVYARWLGVDVYVFVHIPKISNVQILGWLPAEQVEQAPVRWFEDDEGVRNDYAHEVPPEAMYAMPETFDFEQKCLHGVGIWHDTFHAWECFICGRLYYEEKFKQFAKRQGLY
jgi:hypothetical protein